MEQPEHCLNCGTELRGPYCHVCGQPVKGMVRHLRSIVRDVLDTVFEYDSRIWRSLIPLYFLPGRITREFLDGKRIRFVLPFRLFFVLTVVAFLVLQLLAEPVLLAEPAVLGSIEQADDLERVAELQREALAEITEAERTLESGGAGPVPADLLDAQRRRIREAARQRMSWIQEVEQARAAGREPPPPPGDGPGLVLNGQRWDQVNNPVRLTWLPDAANDQINAWVGRAQSNLQRGMQEPGWLLDSFISLLPAALFVLMPIFALMLKVFSLRKHWLYTAHLVVALHSHSFLSLAMRISVLLGTLEEQVAGVPWLAHPLGLVTTLCERWTPLYLLLMQRAVYQQSWPKTLLKFVLIGSIYLVLLSFAAVAVAAIALVVS
jgi:hypothetical protein